MAKRRVLLIAFSCLFLPGFLNSWTDRAYTQNPADCHLRPDACDAKIADALSRFPYWDYKAKAAGGGTHFFLGTSGGYLWGLTCQHCGSGTATWEFATGPHAGQVFDAIGHSGETQSGA